MTSKILLILLIVTMTGKLIDAQELPADSVKRVKEQKKIEVITKRIDDGKQKLAQLEAELVEKANSNEQAIDHAQESADKNREAAVKLSNDANDRKKAKRAEKRSDDARRDAKKARRASNNLKEIEDDIKRLKKRIAQDEKSLSDLNPGKLE
jgi:chromosome segregation ATPase